MLGEANLGDEGLALLQAIVAATLGNTVAVVAKLFARMGKGPARQDGRGNQSRMVSKGRS
jgi:hypothetical protein